MDQEFVVKPVPALRLGELSCTVGAQDDISAHVGPLFGRVWDAMTAAGARPGLGVGYSVVGEDGMECHCGFAYDGEAGPGFGVGELPAVPEAVTLVHHRGTFLVVIADTSELVPSIEYANPTAADWYSGSVSMIEV